MRRLPCHAGALEEVANIKKKLTAQIKGSEKVKLILKINHNVYTCMHGLHLHHY